MSRSFYINEQTSMEYIQKCDCILSAKFLYDKGLDISNLCVHSDFLIDALQIIFNEQCETIRKDGNLELDDEELSDVVLPEEEILESLDYEYLLELRFTSNKWLEMSKENKLKSVNVFHHLSNVFFEQHYFAYLKEDTIVLVGCNLEFAMNYEYLTAVYEHRENFIDA